MKKWEIRPVQASELPHHLPLNGIYEGGKLVATAGNYNHVGSAKYAALIADAPRLAEEVERLRAINAELVEACRELVRVASHIKDAPLADALKYVPISAYHQARAKGKTAIAHAEGRES